MVSCRSTGSAFRLVDSTMFPYGVAFGVSVTRSSTDRWVRFCLPRICRRLRTSNRLTLAGAVSSQYGDCAFETLPQLRLDPLDISRDWPVLRGRERVVVCIGGRNACPANSSDGGTAEIGSGPSRC